MKCPISLLNIKMFPGLFSIRLTLNFDKREHGREHETFYYARKVNLMNFVNNKAKAYTGWWFVNYKKS